MSRNGRRRGFIVACASPQRKISMTAQLNSSFGESSKAITWKSISIVLVDKSLR